MRARWMWGLAVSGTVAILVSVSVAMTALAAPPGEEVAPSPNAHAAMHLSCDSGDVAGMNEAMGTLTEADWQAMDTRMEDGHHSSMGTGMMGMSRRQGHGLPVW